MAMAAQDEYESDEETCWICLDGTKEGNGDELIHPCKCPRTVHTRCLARWQLQCSGRSEEAQCKFCNQKLPSWRKTLFKDVLPLSRRHSCDGRVVTSEVRSSGASRSDSDSEGENLNVEGDIIVKFNGMSFRCQVKTGQEGLEDFMQQIQHKCGIPAEKMASLNLTYRCKDPSTGSQITLEGVNESAFDAAVLCSAAQDQRKRDSAGPDAARSEAVGQAAAVRECLGDVAQEATQAQPSASRMYRCHHRFMPSFPSLASFVSSGF